MECDVCGSRNVARREIEGLLLEECGLCGNLQGDDEAVARVTELRDGRERGLDDAVIPLVAVLESADVFHIEQATADCVKRGGADAIIVTGDATGDAPDRDLIRRAATAAGSAPVLVGSGATEKSIGGLLEVAAGVIVGTALKVDGITTNPVDGARAAAFVEATG